MTSSPLAEHRAEFLAHQEIHALILFLFKPDEWPLPQPLGEFVNALEGEARRWAEFVLANADDPGFELLASALEIATMNFRREYES
ncbi:hypothetical protein [Azotobacter beijerinckii]|uniref:hypothetical protein n=1 Tax=Azotobacter beijerinckii TaxID=170623 RepID=UPI002955DF0C|nr:hypothetical protein [Azotobacter beijerinckii]MDV7210779.1 hypothetical protein [Azotobacter beijerinckii]